MTDSTSSLQLSTALTIILDLTSFLASHLFCINWRRFLAKWRRSHLVSKLVKENFLKCSTISLYRIIMWVSRMWLSVSNTTPWDIMLTIGIPVHCSCDAAIGDLASHSEFTTLQVRSTYIIRTHREAAWKIITICDHYPAHFDKSLRTRDAWLVQQIPLFSQENPPHLSFRNVSPIHARICLFFGCAPFYPRCYPAVICPRSRMASCSFVYISGDDSEREYCGKVTKSRAWTFGSAPRIL
jgi:hypothetical protein